MIRVTKWRGTAQRQGHCERTSQRTSPPLPPPKNGKTLKNHLPSSKQVFQLNKSQVRSKNPGKHSVEESKGYHDFTEMNTPTNRNILRWILGMNEISNLNRIAV